MSSHHNRRKRRQNNEIPVLVERVQRNEQSYQNSGETWKGRPRTGNYEVDNWPYLSPEFRAAHNRRLQARGLPTIPPPKVDLYVAKPSLIKPIDYADKELVAAARQFAQPTMMSDGKDEGFTINGEPAKL